MSLKLEALRTSDLTNMEAGQLMNRHLNDLSTIDQALLTDVPYNNYMSKITANSVIYQKALAQVQKNDETERIALADADRDKAVMSFSKVLKLYSSSDVPDEVEASRILRILFNNFKNLATLNYEAESNAIDKLVSDLESEKYAGIVTFLNIGRYVIRMKETNQEFKSLFSNRMVTVAMTETFDLKVIRKEMLAHYTEFTAYVLAMAKALESPLFNTSLVLLNTARKYYADLLARRTTAEEVKVQPEV